MPFGSPALLALTAYLETRPRASGRDQVFAGAGGKPLSDRTVRRIVARGLIRASIRTKASTHTLRHSFAPHLLDGGADVRVVQELLGHASVTTTQVYTHLDFQHLAKAYDQAHPRAKRKGK